METGETVDCAKTGKLKQAATASISKPIRGAQRRNFKGSISFPKECSSGETR